MKLSAYVAFFIMFLLQGLAQSLSPRDLDEQVLGILLFSNGEYLVTQNGYLLLPDKETNDFYQEYYRKVYKDSTIINPNTILQTPDNSDILNYIVPFIDMSEAGKEFLEFPEGTRLQDFLESDNSGNLVYRQGIYSLIGNYLKKKN